MERCEGESERNGKGDVGHGDTRDAVSVELHLTARSHWKEVNRGRGENTTSGLKQFMTRRGNGVLFRHWSGSVLFTRGTTTATPIRSASSGDGEFVRRMHTVPRRDSHSYGASGSLGLSSATRARSPTSWMGSFITGLHASDGGSSSSLDCRSRRDAEGDAGARRRASSPNPRASWTRLFFRPPVCSDALFLFQVTSHVRAASAVAAVVAA